MCVPFFRVVLLSGTRARWTTKPSFQTMRHSYNQQDLPLRYACMSPQVKRLGQPCLPAKPSRTVISSTASRRVICKSSSNSSQSATTVVCNPSASGTSSPLPGLASPGSKAAAADKGANPAAPLLGLLLQLSAGSLDQWPSWLVVLLVRAVVVAGEAFRFGLGCPRYAAVMRLSCHSPLSGTGLNV